MSSRTINQSSIPAPPLTVRAKAPVFSTEDKLYENRVGGHSEQSTYPTYPTTFKAYVPTAERTLHAIESTARSQPVAMPESDRLMNARQVAARLGVSERWVRDHTTRSRREAQGTRTLCTRSGSRQIYRNQPAVPNGTRPSRDRCGLPRLELANCAKPGYSASRNWPPQSIAGIVVATPGQRKSSARIIQALRVPY